MSKLKLFIMDTIVEKKQKHSLEVQKPVKVAVANGDGIGPEIMSATLKILEAAGARIQPEFIELGEKVYLKGNTSGIDDKA